VNSENPNTEQNVIPPIAPTIPNNTPAPMPTVVPAAVPVQPAPPVQPEVVNGADPRAVGINNSEFIHPEAFEKGKANNDGAVVNEKLKKVEVEYKPPSKFKTFLVILLFVFLIAFVIFLPDITTFVEKKMSGEGGDEAVKITEGRMVCKLSTNTTNLDKSHELIFEFSYNKLERINYTIVTKGDPSEDADTLDELTETCKLLSKETEKIQGASVRCAPTTGKLEEYQAYDLKDLDMNEVRSVFTEAGGLYPEYPYGQDMDLIERSMNASGYDCKRES
jgi:hypothetical protein